MLLASVRRHLRVLVEELDAAVELNPAEPVLRRIEKSLDEIERLRATLDRIEGRK